MITSIPELTITLGDSELSSLDEDDLRRAVAEYNRRPGAGRPELPDEANPRCLAPDKVVAFVEALPRLDPGSRTLLEGQSLDLAHRGLRLRAVSGFGEHALRGGVSISRERSGFAVVPEHHIDDVAADLDVAMSVVADKTARVEAADKALEGLQRGDPGYPERFRERAQAKQEQALAWSAALPLVRAGAELVGEGRVTVAGETWDSDRFDAERKALESKMRSAPATGGMPAR